MRIDSLFEGALLALDQLRANKFRSALTIIGIVVGVAVVMAMSGLIEGIRSSVVGELERMGPKNFMVARYNFAGPIIQTDMDGPPWGSNPAITVNEARLMNRLPAIERAAVGVDLSGEFTYEGARVANVQVLGREDGWSAFTAGEIVMGHDMLEHDVRSSAPVAVITKPLAETLFGSLDPVGRRVRINGVPFEVIGVFEQAANLFASLQRNWAVVPYTAALKHLDAWDGMLLAFVITADEFTQDAAIDQVITALRIDRGLTASADNDFAIVRQEQMVDTFNQITGVFFIVMLALSSVALMVGGVGVIAIMMIAVTERTREIGIRKAIGATRKEILWQFLFESATVTVIGGIIGMAIGAGIAFLVAGLTPIPARVPFLAVVAALGMAAVSGVLFGMWPAWKASRLDPVAALRYE